MTPKHSPFDVPNSGSRRPALRSATSADGPRSADPKVPISIRLDRAVVEKFRATGPGWQSRINEVLRKATPWGAPQRLWGPNRS